MSSIDDFDYVIDGEINTSFATVIALIKKLDQKIENLTTEVLNSGQALANLTDKLQSVEGQCAAMAAMAGRNVPKNQCVFCSNEQNNNGHTSGRCQQYPDVVARALRVAELALCKLCLKPTHNHECHFKCNICQAEHNTLLCPNKGAAYSHRPYPIKKRKF